MEDLELKIKCAKIMLKVGCAVLPVRPGTNPNIHNATKKPHKFESYVRAHPDRNYVVATGKVSGVFVVRINGAKRGPNLDTMVSTNGRLPSTMVVSTKEGIDVYCAMPNARVPNCTIADGVEVHGDDSFVLGPGSKHASGRTVVFSPRFAPVEERIPPAPDWLLQTINTTAEIARLAKLPGIDYERERVDAAKRLSFRIAVLDKLVQQARNASQGDTGKKGIPSLREPELWPDQVDGAELLGELTNAVLRYVVVPKDVARAIALWIVHTYALAAAHVSPRLAIKSPVKGCGKTTLLDVMSCLVCRSLITSNVTAAALFRIVDLASPTLLIDEADTFLIKNDELRGILNTGYRRNSARILRSDGEDNEPREFTTWGAAAVATIGSLPDALEDRSIRVHLRARHTIAESGLA